MIVDGLRTDIVDGQHELSADVTFEDEPRRTERVWFRWPEAYGRPETIGDPFLAGLVISAMALRERLHVEAPVSRALLVALRERLTPVMRRWGWDEAAVPVTAIETDPATVEPGDEQACFFSAGVDSFHSFLSNRDETTHLLLMRGFEVSVDDDVTWRAARSHVADIAEQHGKTLVSIASNLGRIGANITIGRLEAQGRPVLEYHRRRYSGTQLVAFAQCLQQRVHRFIVPSSLPWEWLMPHGTHPLIEPAWSTAAAAFDLDGLETDRIGKVRWLCENAPDAVGKLRVCYGTEHGELNCGRCPKCLLTRIHLDLLGHADLAVSFDRELDLRAVRRVSKENRGPYQWPPTLAEAERLGRREIARAMRVGMRLDFSWYQFWQKNGPRLRQAWLSAPGRRFTLRLLGKLPTG
jgi:hypothetical protein